MCYHSCCCCKVASIVSDSVWPHRRQPTRLPRPGDYPGKNAGVGCHFLLQCMKVKSEREVAQSCPTLRDPMNGSLPGSTIHGIFQARVLEWVAIAFSQRDEQILQGCWSSNFSLMVSDTWHFCTLLYNPKIYFTHAHGKWLTIFLQHLIFGKFWLFMLWSSLSCFSCVQLFVTPWTVAHQAPLSVEFSRQEYWSRLPFPSPGDLPHPGLEPRSPTL